MGQRWSRLIQLRSEASLTQEELSQRLKITRSALSNYESGAREPDFATINKIADFFLVSVDFLLGRTAQRDPSVQTAEISPDWQRVLKLAQERGYSYEDIEATLEVIDRMVNRKRTDSKGTT